MSAQVDLGAHKADGGARHLLLFLAGDEPNSRIARANLDRLRSTYDTNGWEIEIVDILADFGPALEHHILVTPALLQTQPEPRVLVIGNLSELDKVCIALGLPVEARAAKGVVP